MENRSVYTDISERTQGDIYIGVVGPVRTGKSTFIKRFMELLVLPNIQNEYIRERASDELPQSAAGKTIMTTEPKFIPEDGVKIELADNASFEVRMIDCVGYIVPSSLGYFENEAPRMVKTPWVENEIPFNMAAELGTQKVITEHSTIGLVVTTDGSITDIPREEYAEAEERVINELKAIRKPFVILLNSQTPNSPSVVALRKEMEEKYNAPVSAVNCMEMSEEDIKAILEKTLFEFPVKEIEIDIPSWVVSLEGEHWLKSAVYEAVKRSIAGIEKIREVKNGAASISGCEYVVESSVKALDLGKGRAQLTVRLQNNLFYKILSEKTGVEISGEEELMPCISELIKVKKEYEKIKGAMEQVAATGYGIVMPTLEELTLEEPEMVRQGGKYGVRLRASAPSIHLMKADITTEVCPVVGSEKQSEELVKYLMQEFEENPLQIWESNIFGKSLHELVNEGLHNKLYRMPQDARMKLQETIEKIINEGCSGLICIIL